MKTRNLIVLCGSAIAAGVIASLMYTVRGLLPDIATKVIIVILVIASLTALYAIVALVKRMNALITDMRLKHLEHQEREQRMLREEERHTLEMLALRADVHVKLSRLAPDGNGYYPALLPGQFLSPAEMMGNVLMLPPAQQNRGLQGNTSKEVQEQSGQALPAPLLTFSQLLEQGIIQAALAQEKMVLGYYAENHTLRYGSWLDLYSCGIGGVSGSGKSTTVRFLLFQAMLVKARFIFVDPHIADEEESLAAQFRVFSGVHQFPPCNASPKEVLQRVRWLKREFDRRKKTGMKAPFLILVIDEFNAVMRVKEVRDELSALLLEIEQEARKFGIFAMLLAQRWSAQDLGGADIRTSLASFLVHRFTDEEQARKIAGSRNGPRCLELDTGHWLFRDTKGKLNEMVTPETYSEDGERVMRLAGTSTVTSIPASKGTSTGPLVLTEDMQMQLSDVGTTAPVEPVDATRALQVRALLLERKGQNEIIESLWGVRSSDGRPYRAAVDEYRDILASIVSQVEA